MSRVYVIAGNHAQYVEYKRRKHRENDGGVEEYVYVSSVNTIRGIRDPSGVFIGTWRDRTDIMDILMHLRLYQSFSNPRLEEIWDSMKVAATTQQVVSANVTQAAEDLKKQINDHLLKQVHNTIQRSGWDELWRGQIDSIIDNETQSYKNYWRNDYGS